MGCSRASKVSLIIPRRKSDAHPDDGGVTKLRRFNDLKLNLRAEAWMRHFSRGKSSPGAAIISEISVERIADLL